MKITFSSKHIDTTPKGYARVRITENSLKRFVVDGGVETLEIGTGKPWSEIDRRAFILLCRSIVSTAKQHKVKKVAIQLSLSPFPKMKGTALPELGSLIAQSFVMANYEFNTHKSKPKDGWSMVEEILICGETPKAMVEGFKRGQIIGEEINKTRELSNMPGGDMTPTVLANAAKMALKGTKVSVKVLGRAEMQKLGMGAVLGIAKGSIEEPKFIIMEYKGGPAAQKPIVLAGKGVTFDTGGLNIKTGDHMYEMHMDMSGGAAVIHTLALAAKLGIKKNIVGLVPAVENAPGQDAVRPGDILKSLSGKTIEIVNTDAEGRVILADAITYAKRYNPAAVIDVATLTGASLIALGTEASAFMTNQPEKVIDVMAAAETSGDYMWPFPAWEEYESLVQGGFADVPNIPVNGNSRYGGVIGGGMFLREFAKEINCLWIHIDMAPRMTASPTEHLAKGAAGAPVRFLLSFIETYGGSTAR